MNAHMIIFPTIVFAIITYLSAFKDGKPVCDNYVLNTYLYTVTYMFMLCYFVMWIMQTPKLLKLIDFSLWKVLLLIVVNIGSFLFIQWADASYALIKHVLSVLFIASSGVLLALAFMFFDSKAITFAVTLSVILFIVLSVIAWQFQQLISSKLSMAFIVVFIIMLIVELIVGIMYPASMIEKIVIFAMLMLICYLVLVKTKKMIENAGSCTKPDYVKESTGFIVSFENILLRILQLKSGRRIR